LTIGKTQNPGQALRYCRGITRRRARNFYWGLKLLPEPQRSALYAVYAWMRRADDIVDDAADVPAARREIARFRAATVSAFSGGVDGGDPVLLALHDIASRFRLGIEHFHAGLDGQLDDLNGRRYETFEDLQEYCRRVASSVGQICIEIWGYDGTDAPAQADDRGVAFQLTNILRDVVEDARAGRVYLPAEDFARYDLTPRDLLAWSPPDRCRAFLAEQIARAEFFYRRSAPLDDAISASCRPTLWAMTTIYHRLLEKMSRNPAQLVRGPRIRLSTMRKGTIAVRARWRSGAPWAVPR
jgi:phytoene synthase